MTIRLHHCHGTRSQRVMWLLNELDVPFETVLWPFDKTLRSEAFSVHNPVGRVPALEIDGETMIESGAMIEYLCDRFPDYGLGRMVGDLDRIEWLQWLHFAETISHHTTNLTQQHIVLRDPAMRSPILTRIEAQRLARCLAAVEARLSPPVENRDHLLTSGFSACDIAVWQAVDMARHFVALDPYPQVSEWFDRLARRPACRAAMPPPGEGLYPQPFYAPLADPPAT